MRFLSYQEKCGFLENAEFREKSPTNVGDAFMRPVCANMLKIEHDIVYSCDDTAAHECVSYRFR